ncbi:hypothetical protein [Bartonella choladocola]|uniref:hypothetical protein n=1 Tax=Bartonella choladocola TaxID=2750995 RepID=UPI003B52191F
MCLSDKAAMSTESIIASMFVFATGVLVKARSAALRFILLFSVKKAVLLNKAYAPIFPSSYGMALKDYLRRSSHSIWKKEILTKAGFGKFATSTLAVIVLRLKMMEIEL